MQVFLVFGDGVNRVVERLHAWMYIWALGNYIGPCSGTSFPVSGNQAERNWSSTPPRFIEL
jgi:hypothetical protein